MAALTDNGLKNSSFITHHSSISIGTDIATAATWLAAGQCVGIPTETVYGLAANALDGAAVAKIFSVKDRPAFDPLIVHIPNATAAVQYAAYIPLVAQRLMEAFWPGPLTLLLPKRDIIPDLVTSGLPRVGLRVPAHPLTLALLNAIPFPLAAPSANPFGYISPTTVEHVVAQLGDKIPYILDGGPCQVGVESTIIGFDEEDCPVVYRFGGLSLETLEAVCGPIRMAPDQSSNPAAPGMLASHYAPRKRLYLGDISQLLPSFSGKRVALLTFGNQSVVQPVARIENLSEQADFSVAAQRLFAALRALDADPDIDLILAEPLPEAGLGRAINDRLRRAAAVDTTRIWDVLDTVNDPEIPVLSVIDLGIVRAVQVDSEGRLEVLITPTYSGCPAMRVIEWSILAAVQGLGFADAQVRTILQPAWTTDWMTEAGRQKLREYGIAPPHQKARTERLLFEAPPTAACPHCGDKNTEQLSEFGSTACKSLFRCKNCLEPFDYFRCH